MFGQFVRVPKGDTAPYEEALRVGRRVIVATVAIEHTEGMYRGKGTSIVRPLCPVAKGRSYGEELGMIDASPLQTVIEAHGAMTRAVERLDSADRHRELEESGTSRDGEVEGDGLGECHRGL